MPIEVRTVTTASEAAGLLAGDRQARLLSGGTLLMRDVNEGRLLDGLLVRLVDPAYRQITLSGGRVELGAGVTMAMVLKRRDLASLHAAAQAIGGPAVRNMATVGGNLFAEAPYGDFTVALLALDAQVMVMQGYGAPRAIPLEEFLNARSRGGQGLVTGVQLALPQNASDLRFRKVSRVRPKGVAVLSIAAHLPMAGGRVGQARASPSAPWRRRRSGPSRSSASWRERSRPGHHRRRARGGGGRHPPGDRCGGQRVVPLRGPPVHLARLLSGEK